MTRATLTLVTCSFRKLGWKHSLGQALRFWHRPSGHPLSTSTRLWPRGRPRNTGTENQTRGTAGFCRFLGRGRADPWEGGVGGMGWGEGLTEPSDHGPGAASGGGAYPSLGPARTPTPPSLPSSFRNAWNRASSVPRWEEGSVQRSQAHSHTCQRQMSQRYQD